MAKLFSIYPCVINSVENVVTHRQSIHHLTKHQLNGFQSENFLQKNELSSFTKLLHIYVGI